MSDERSYPRYNRREVLKMGAGLFGELFLGSPTIRRLERFINPAVIDPNDFLASKTSERKSTTATAPEAIERTDNTMYWQEVVGGPRPPAAYRQAGIYSESLGGVVVYGGWDQTGCIDQTSFFDPSSNQWHQIEGAGAPKLSGSKMVETRLGVFMFGGIEQISPGVFDVSNKGYLLTNEQGNFRWKQIATNISDNSNKRQGFGMLVVDDGDKVLIVGGADNYGMTSRVSEINVPHAPTDSWEVSQLTPDTGNPLPIIFEPLVWSIGSETYLYGGLEEVPIEGGIQRVNVDIPRKLIRANGTLTSLTQSWTRSDYGGAVRGGYDIKKQRLFISCGYPQSFWGNPYDYPVYYKKDTDEWVKVESPKAGPPVLEKPISVQLPNGEWLVHAGIHYESNGQPSFQNATWRLKQEHKIFAPVIAKN